MSAYYAGQTEYPLVHLLPALAQALSVSTDELLGGIGGELISGVHHAPARGPVPHGVVGIGCLVDLGRARYNLACQTKTPDPLHFFVCTDRRQDSG